MPWRGPNEPGEFPTLGYDVGEWIEGHCIVPDGYRMGEQYLLTDEQWRFLIGFYRLYPYAAPWPAPDALRYTGAQLRRVQKWGKDPFGAAIILAEALGPTRFDGWNAKGEPVGAPYPSPLIVCLGTSEDQTQNTWRPLLSMIRRGPLINLAGMDAGQTRVDLPGGGRIEPVTTSAKARLGAPLTFLTCTEALALDTPIPTPSGWTTMGALGVGDMVFGRDGLPVEVVGATDVQVGRECYRVRFDDGTEIIASDGHLWETRLSNSAALPRIRTTAEMVLDGRKFRIPVPDAAKLPELPLPLPAYTLGLWIGDGDSQTAAVSVGGQDLSEILSLLAEDGCATSVRRNQTCTAVSVRFNHGQWYGKSGGTSVAGLRELGLLNNKHIPTIILRASPDQRLAFLQGLMDSDGHCTKIGQCQFSTNKRHIANGVMELLRSLGQIPRLNRQDDTRSRTGEMFKVYFVPRNIVPFRLARKVARCTLRRSVSGISRYQVRRAWLSITAIEPVSSVPVRCISVAAADELFLAGSGWHPTHNSHLFTLQGGFRRVAGAVKRNVAGMDGRWLELTNGWDPSEGSEAQVTGDTDDDRVLVDTIEPHRVADLADTEAVYAELLRQYADSAREVGGWVNVRGRILSEVQSSRHLEADRRRFFLNEIVVGESVFVDPIRWDLAEKAEEPLQKGDKIALGFDGSKNRDATALVASRIADGRLFTLRVWERPPNVEEWRVPSPEVDSFLHEVFTLYQVGYLYADPWRWQDYLDRWSAEWPKHIVEFATNVESRMDIAIERFTTAFAAGELTHDGHETLARHAKNAVLVKGGKKKSRPGAEDETLPTHYLKMAKRGDGMLIDAVVAAVLAHAARGQSIEDDLFAEEPVQPFFGSWR